jgi:hypothetical protein
MWRTGRSSKDVRDPLDKLEADSPSNALNTRLLHSPGLHESDINPPVLPLLKRG